MILRSDPLLTITRLVSVKGGLPDAVTSSSNESDESEED